MLFIGGDIGHTNVKTCTGLNRNSLDIFRSTVGPVNSDILDKKTDMIIKYKGEELAVGTNYGNFSTQDDKSKDEIFKICLFTSIARAMKGAQIENICLVTGLPLNYYKKYKEALVDSLEGTTVEIEYMGQKKIFNFQYVKPYPESIGLVLLEKDNFKGPRIVVDIGGSTVDVSYFEGTTLIKTASYDLGMHKVYSKIAASLNEKYGTDYNVQAAERILKERLIVVDDKEIEYSPDKYLKQHAEEIMGRIKLDFHWKTSYKTFIGGGAIELKNYLPNSQLISYDNVFANAKAFYLIGVSKYGQR